MKPKVTNPDKIILIPIGSRLRELRRRKNLSQKKVSEYLGLQNQSGYQKYEANAVVPPPDKLQALAELFGVSTDYLLGLKSAEADDFAWKVIRQGLPASLVHPLAEAVLGLSPENELEFRTFLEDLKKQS